MCVCLILRGTNARYISSILLIDSNILIYLFMQSYIVS